jgi:hypothetical protein
VLQALKKLSAFGVTIVTVIHQPRYSIFKMFDSVRCHHSDFLRSFYASNLCDDIPIASSRASAQAPRCFSVGDLARRQRDRLRDRRARDVYSYIHRLWASDQVLLLGVGGKEVYLVRIRSISNPSNSTHYSILADSPDVR